MKETLKLGLILMIITVISAGILATTNTLTKERIAEMELEKSLSALRDIFGNEYEFENMNKSIEDEIKDKNPEIIEISEVYLDGELEGYAIKTKSGGYAGDLIVLTGISKSKGEVVGMKLLEHTETATLGGKATDKEFEERFPGKSVDEEVSVEVISGATVTTNGVLKGVNIARELYNKVLSN